jgi:Phosphopantetheine attachment site
VTGDEGWEEFRARLSELTGVPLEDVTPAARLVEDLGLDSLGITEVAVLLLVDYELDGLSDGLQRSGWDGVTAGDVYEECRGGRRGGWELKLG